MSKRLNTQSLEAAMVEKGLNKAGLADALGVTRQLITKWFQGSFPRPDKLLKLALVTGLGYSDIVISELDPTEPVVAFRTKKKSKATTAHIDAAKDKGRILQLVVPYLPHDKFSRPPSLKQPSADYSYLQNATSSLRKELGVDSDEELKFHHLIGKFAELQAVIIPVLWGAKVHHGNALHVYLPDSMTTWIYLNLDAEVHDFKFWMAHELAHALSPELRGDTAEDFADAFAGALLFPEEIAREVYLVVKALDPSAQLNVLVDYANQYTISPITVYKQVCEFVKYSKQEPINLEPAIYAAATNFNKQFPTFSESLFGDKKISPKKYLDIAIDVFSSPFFDSLQSMLRDSGKSSNLIQSLLDIPLIDAKGLYSELV
jgi:transcriptional regulator with XRE-family HTH domain